MIGKVITAITGNPLVLMWLLLGAFAFGLASGGAGAWWVQGVRLDNLQNKYDKFVNDTAALGKQAAMEKKATEAADKLKKEKSDVDHKTALSKLAADNKRLRNERAGRGYVPEAPAASRRPDLACFDRSELDVALRRFDQEVSGIVEEGAANTLTLKDAQTWAVGK